MSRYLTVSEGEYARVLLAYSRAVSPGRPPLERDRRQPNADYRKEDPTSPGVQHVVHPFPRSLPQSYGL
jgi:hypothetical protein